MTYEHALRWLRLESAELATLYPTPRLDYRGRTIAVETVRAYLVQEERRFAEAISMLPPPPRPGMRLIEIGIAYGFLAALAKAAGWAAEGLEVPENIPVYCAFALHHEIPVHPGKLGVKPLDLPEGRYGAVIFSEVLEHLRLPTPLVFRELHRILAPGGYLLLTTPNMARLSNVAKLLLGRNVVEAFPEDAECENATELLTHVREYTMRELRQGLAHAGFDEVSARYSACMERRKLRRLLTAWIPCGRGNLMILARKRA
ncbi:MAG: class I SAM-dependent methyltransferase [Verrucomicrobiae bacterium]|nr:class I SAM-dependent methyltransferase [Verrucomicrobiae bacterium]